MNLKRIECAQRTVWLIFDGAVGRLVQRKFVAHIFILIYGNVPLYTWPECYPCLVHVLFRGFCLEDEYFLYAVALSLICQRDEHGTRY